ncbi:MAG: DUF1993 domain-containing protein [Bdellovibrionota bacterium]
MYYQLTVPSFIKGLRSLAACLDKGAAYADMKKFDSEILANARLAPDQFNLIRQVQIACDTAKLCASRLTGKEAPSNPDTEKTIAELKTRIQSTISFLEKFTERDYAEEATRQVTQKRWEGKWLTGEDYALFHAIPNFYFHVTTAYAILRHNGVDVGKGDYLGELPFKK